jgi:hypothetical protein
MKRDEVGLASSFRSLCRGDVASLSLRRASLHILPSAARPPRRARERRRANQRARVRPCALAPPVSSRSSAPSPQARRVLVGADLSEESLARRICDPRHISMLSAAPFPNPTAPRPTAPSPCPPYESSESTSAAIRSRERGHSQSAAAARPVGGRNEDARVVWMMSSRVSRPRFVLCAPQAPTNARPPRTWRSRRFVACTS